MNFPTLSPTYHYHVDRIIIFEEWNLFVEVILSGRTFIFK